jgi:hypothetical protein
MRILALRAGLPIKNFRMKTKLLEEGDVIELVEGHKVYADIPEHFAYSNRRGVFKPTHAEAVIGGELAYLAGRYIVYKTTLSGGGIAPGPNDVYPDGHHVYAEREDGIKVDFYQTGGFTAMIPEIKPIGRATRKWVFEANPASEPR